jgi:hypothetical protein
MIKIYYNIYVASTIHYFYNVSDKFCDVWSELHLKVMNTVDQWILPDNVLCILLMSNFMDMMLLVKEMQYVGGNDAHNLTIMLPLHILMQYPNCATLDKWCQKWSAKWVAKERHILWGTERNGSAIPNRLCNYISLWTGIHLSFFVTALTHCLLIMLHVFSTVKLIIFVLEFWTWFYSVLHCCIFWNVYVGQC